MPFFKTIFASSVFFSKAIYHQVFQTRKASQLLHCCPASLCAWVCICGSGWSQKEDWSNWKKSWNDSGKDSWKDSWEDWSSWKNHKEGVNGFVMSEVLSCGISSFILLSSTPLTSGAHFHFSQCAIGAVGIGRTLRASHQRLNGLLCLSRLYVHHLSSSQIY